VAVLLAVANRGPVSVVLDPFAREAPSLVYKLPLFALVLGAVVVGVLLGGIGAWLTQAKHRRAERQLRRETEQLRVEVARLKQQGTAASLSDRRAA
jgi:uncharacterized integral membrane protein